jgi:hypothetical protein
MARSNLFFETSRPDIPTAAPQSLKAISIFAFAKFRSRPQFRFARVAQTIFSDSFFNWFSIHSVRVSRMFFYKSAQLSKVHPVVESGFYGNLNAIGVKVVRRLPSFEYPKEPQKGDHRDESENERKGRQHSLGIVTAE